MNDTRAKILVVDDDPLVLKVTCQVLESAGFEAFSADSGVECIRLARELRPDLVLLDLNMPGLSGAETCKQMKSNSELRDIFVILFSGSHTDSDSQSGGLESGADGFITRPITNRELIARVQSMLRIQVAETATKKMLAQWQATFDSVGDIVFLTDKDFNILNCNRAAIQFFHLPAEEIIGKRCHHVLHCAKSPISECPSQLVMTSKQRQVFVFERNDRWLEVSMDPTLEATTGAFTGTVHVIKDVTERKRAEEELRLQSEVTANIAEGVVLVRVEDAKIVYANPKFEEMFGYGRGELIGKDVSIVNASTSKSPEDVAIEIEHALKENGAWSGQIHNIKKNGETFWCSANISTFDHPTFGRVWVTVQSDITEQKEAEDRLRKSDAILAQAGMIAHLGGWEIEISNHENINANPLVWSDEVYRIFGYEPGAVDVTNDLFFEHVHPDDRQVVADALERAFVNKQPYEVEHRIIRRDGAERIVLEHAEITFDNTGLPTRILGAIQDITERKQAEDALRESEEKFSKIFHNSPTIMMLADIEALTILDVNQAYCLRMGYAREEVVNISGKLGFSGSQEQIKAALELIRKNEKFSDFELVLRTKSGDQITGLMFADPIDLQGKRLYILTFIDITERKQADISLQESEEKYRLIAENADDWVYWRTPDNLFRYVSPSCERMTGYSPEEFINNPDFIIGITHPEDKEILANHFACVEADEEYSQLEYRIIRKSGETRWINHSCSPLYREGKFMGRRGNNQDITERKQAENALIESEKAHRLLIQHLHAGVVVHAPNSQVLLANDQACKLLGLTVSQMLGKDAIDAAWQFVHEDGTPMLVEEYPVMQVITSQAPLMDLVVGIQRSQESDIVWALANAFPEFDAPGQLREIVVTFIDITERKQATESLRQSEKRFATVFNASPVAIGITEFDGGRLLDVNEAWEKLTGYSRLEVLEKSPVQLNLWVDPHQRQEMVQTAREQGRARSDVQIRPRTGEIRDVLMLAEAIELSGKPCLLTIGQDITARKRAETELKKRASQLALINQVGQKIAGVLAIQGVLDLAARLVNETFGYYHVALFTFDEQQQNFVMRARAGQFSNYFPENHRIPLGEGMVGTVGKSGQMILSNDVRVEGSYRNYFPQLLPTAAELSLPIRVGDKVVGVLDVQSPYTDAFNDDDVMVLEILADQVAVALEDARLYEAIWKELIERKQIENELVQHRDHLEELVKARTAEVQDLYDNAPCGYHSLDANGNFVMINQTELNWLGYAREEILGHPIADILTEKSLAFFQTNFPSFKKSGRLKDFELEYIRRDGSIMPILISATAIYDPSGNFLMSRSTVFDNTERKQAEKSLRESEEQNRLLFEETPEAITLLDISGKVIRTNRAFEQLIKIPFVKMVGKSATELGVIAEGAYEDLKAAFDQSIVDDKDFIAVEYKLLCGDGSQRDVESRLFRLKLGGDDRILIVSRDISTQKETEEALRRANKEMGQAMRLKDEFLASMSHELRTPLTGILGLSEALQMKTYGEFNEKQLKALKNIESSGRHLLELINDILDLSKIEAGKLEMQLEPCSLGDICQASLQMTKGLAQQKHQDVSFSMNPASVIVRADARRLKQMLVNLLSNAVKFTPENGSLGLEVHASAAEQVVKVTVWDKGIGIATEDIKRLFKPFVQLDSSLARQHSGTGLGLSLVQRMAELHGGSVQVESTPSNGSRFTIVLPWSPDETQPALPNRRNTGTLRSSLTIDDNEVDAEQITRYLRLLDITNVVHPLGKGAVDLAARLNPGVILLDLALPDIAGFELLTAFKADERTKHIPVVICSVEESQAEAISRGAAGYLVKPYVLSDLKEQLSRVAYQGKPQTVPASIDKKATDPLVLVADDNQVTVQILTDFLEAYHFRVVSVTNGAELLELAPKIHPDIILMDIQMPGMDGLEATRRLRAHDDARLAQVPIIALTALAMPGDRELCLQAGANEYISKPVQLKGLVEVIQGMLGSDAQ